MRLCFNVVIVQFSSLLPTNNQLHSTKPNYLFDSIKNKSSQCTGIYLIPMLNDQEEGDPQAGCIDIKRRNGSVIINRYLNFHSGKHSIFENVVFFLAAGYSNSTLDVSDYLTTSSTREFFHKSQPSMSLLNIFFNLSKDG